ncbi:Transcriptional regulatory protein WalR [bioreactor metagenome]|uniref:Transcriptional regulatory protein WalR n=1 Tax=bioreactor metagenome TaxID=1076179 RepID=A0A645G2E5_9ZZZZ|nr:response regulator transcription factor [Oscillospiraceae bacterium]
MDKKTSSPAVEKKRILIVEDEKNIAEILSYNIKRSGFDAMCVYDGKCGLEEALDGKYDLILLDLMLPIMDGFEVCRRIRRQKDTPIIMLTAREEETDKITGLELGADDYLTKPFSIPELISRIKANIRRYSNELVQERLSADIIKVGELVINNTSYEVTRAGEKLSLSKKEYELLVFLAKNANRVYTREELMEKVWGYEGFYGDIRTVDVTVTRLRKKISGNSEYPEYIETRRGTGYIFIAP